MKVLITGGSGFIGTNTVQYYLDKGWEVLNLSRSKPRNKEHDIYWREASVDNYEDMRIIIIDFAPDYIIHLAGRTDMDGKRAEDYSTNVEGTRNILKVAKECTSIKKVLFVSSALVCKPEHIPNIEREYLPHNYYGQSKAVAEELVWKDSPKYDWSIIRPTNIWGPWQTNSYIHFFRMILAGRYFHIGKCRSKKTFGYVGNIVYQMDVLLNTNTKEIKKVFYLGDYEPYDISEWADEIAGIVGKKISDIPHWIAKCGATIGDFIKLLGISFPLTSRRLQNMKTDNVVDLRDIQKLANPLPFSREAGVKETIKWIQNN